MLKLRICVVVVCLLSAVSCREVLLPRPVPAKEDSVVDTRLIGAWKLIKEEESELKKLPTVIVVGRSEKSKTTMDYLLLNIPRISVKKKSSKQDEIEKKEELQYFRGKLYLHRGKIDTLCTDLPRSSDEVKNQFNPFFMFRYELKDSNTLLLYKLNFDHLIKAVNSKQLRGKLEREQLPETKTVDGGANKIKKITQKKDEKNEGKVVSVVLDDDPNKIIRYLESHSEAFRKKPTRIYRRIQDSLTGG